MIQPPRPTPFLYSGQVRASMLACWYGHEGVYRKSSGVPYSLHPFSVALLLIALGAPEHIVCAAFEHDLVEDVDTETRATVADRAGQLVSDAVFYATKIEEVDGVALTKEQRNELIYQTMLHAPILVALLKAGDLYINVSDSILDSNGRGREYLDELYGAEKAEQKVKHYLRLGAMLVERLREPHPELAGIRHREFAEMLSRRLDQLREMLDGTPAGHRALRAPTDSPMIYSGRVRQALTLAERAYAGRTRKASSTPYVLNAMATALVLAAVSDDEDLICAALLEDAVEGGHLSLVEIEDLLGRRVAQYIWSVTQDDIVDGQQLSGTEKDERTITNMQRAPLATLLLKGADVLVNIVDISYDHLHQGPQHWIALFGDRLPLKLDYYTRLGDLISQGLAEDTRAQALHVGLKERVIGLGALARRTLGEDWRPTHA